MSSTTAPQYNELDNLLSDEATNRPAAYYKKLRDLDPVYWNERWNGWVVTSYDAVIAGYRDSARLSSDRFAGPFGVELQSSISKYQQLMNFMSRFFVWKDAPFHTQMRLIVNSAFTPKSVEVFRPRVQQLVREITDTLEGRDSVDFMTEFAFTLPVTVITEFLGVPSEASHDVRRWSEDLAAIIFSAGDVENRLQKGEESMKKIVDFMRPIVRDRMKNPREDLISRMVHAEENGIRLSEDDVIANAVLMVFAGHDTTMNLLAGGMIAFADYPDQWQRLRGDLSLIKSATEELLRYDGPVRSLGRWAKEPFEFFGKNIKENDRLLLVQYAANRDPDTYENPDKLDIGRVPNRHIGFGQGVHTCLGAPLARLEVQEALSCLSQRFSKVEVLTEELKYDSTVVARSLQGLNLRLHS